MSRILVTGGAGAIGSRLVRALCVDHEILVLDDLSSGWIENIRGLPISFWRGSITDDEILEEVFSNYPEKVIHLAANFANQNSVDYPMKDLQVNGIGTLKLLQFAKRGNVKKFVYSSSSCVYGNTGPLAQESSTDYSLDTPYAVTKLLGEQYVNFFARHHGLATVILRFFNNYGPGEYPGKYRNVIPNFMRIVLNGEPITITGSGQETRDFTFVDDTVQAIKLALFHDNAEGFTFNVGTGRETSIIDLVNSICQVCDRKVPINFVPRRNWDTVARRSADVSLISQKLGFRQSVELQQGLEKTYQWFLDTKIVENAL